MTRKFGEEIIERKRVMEDNSFMNELKALRAQLELDGKTEVVPPAEFKKFKKMKRQGVPLPPNVKIKNGSFVYVKKNELSYDEYHELIQLKGLLYLRSIKNYLTFFVALAVISLILVIVVFAVQMPLF